MSVREDIRTRCRSLYEVLSDYLDGELTSEESRLVEEHVATCPPCKGYLEQFKTLYRMLGHVRREDLPPDFDHVMGGVLEAWRAARGRS